MSADLLTIQPEKGNGTMTARPLRLETLEDVIQHVNFHEGSITAMWEEQHRFNERSVTSTTTCQGAMQAEIREIKEDIKAMRKTIYIAMGGATALGSVIGVVASIFRNLSN